MYLFIFSFHFDLGLRWKYCGYLRILFDGNISDIEVKWMAGPVLHTLMVL